MKIAVINKSDTLGGAAVVAHRMVTALQARGHDVTMLVAQRLSDDPACQPIASKVRTALPFLTERLGIFLANGRDRATLFQIDDGSRGLPLHLHPVVKEADAIVLNWINQGVLSLEGIEELAALGKPIVWVMHDMWPMTGICHHAATCDGYFRECGDCPLLGKRGTPDDLSHRVWCRKHKVYQASAAKITFVAVSRWLAACAHKSSLLRYHRVEVIPNPFHLPAPGHEPRRKDNGGKCMVLMGAARLDDPVKGLPEFMRACEIIAKNHPEVASKIEVVTFGTFRDSRAMEGLKLPHRHLGTVAPDRLPEIYSSAEIVVSSSQYETLPGTLVEGQAYGAIPVSFDRGGQSDIIDHLQTGYLAHRSESAEESAQNLARGILWAISLSPSQRGMIMRDMRQSVTERFDADRVAARLESLLTPNQNPTPHN